MPVVPLNYDGPTLIAVVCLSVCMCVCVNDRETTDRSLLDKAAEYITQAFPSHDRFYPQSLFIATWNEVGYYESQNDRVGLFIVQKSYLR